MKLQQEVDAMEKALAIVAALISDTHGLDDLS
jgi:hypothetical protein